MRKPPKKSLLATLLMRLGKEPPPPRPARPPRPFQAVSIYRGTSACAMARKFSEHRFLAKDAPPLPLAGCTMRNACQCRYLKHKDRRSESRRLIDFGLAPKLFDSQERRRRGRRASDR